MKAHFRVIPNNTVFCVVWLALVNFTKLFFPSTVFTQKNQLTYISFSPGVAATPGIRSSNICFMYMFILIILFFLIGFIMSANSSNYFLTFLLFVFSLVLIIWVCFLMNNWWIFFFCARAIVYTPTHLFKAASVLVCLVCRFNQSEHLDTNSKLCFTNILKTENNPIKTTVSKDTSLYLHNVNVQMSYGKWSFCFSMMIPQLLMTDDEA